MLVCIERGVKPGPIATCCRGTVAPQAQSSEGVLAEDVAQSSHPLDNAQSLPIELNSQRRSRQNSQPELDRRLVDWPGNAEAGAVVR